MNPFAGEFFEVLLVRLENCFVVQARYGGSEYAVGFVMIKDEEADLPSSETNGNEPVKSWYTRPLVLSANATKQNIFAIESSSSMAIKFGSSMTACCAGTGAIGWGPVGC